MTLGASQPLDKPPLHHRLRWLGAVSLCALAASVPILLTTKALEAGSIRWLVIQTTVPCLLLGLLFCRVIRARVLLPKGWIGWGFLLLPFAAGLACVSVQSGWQNGLQEVWRLVTLIALTFIASQVMRNEAERRILVGSIATAAAGISIYAFSQKLGYDPISWSTSSQNRVFATVGNPNMLAAYCVAVVPLLLGSLQGIKSLKWRIAVGLSGGMLSVTLLLTECRGAILGVAATVATALLIYRKPLFKSRRRSIAATIVLTVVATLACIPLVNRFDDWRNLGKAKVGSSNVRLVIWRGTWRMICNNPVLGVGPGQFTARFPEYRDPNYETYGVTHNTLHAHCEPLEVLAELGLIGFLALTGFIGLVLWLGFRQLKKHQGFNHHFLAGLLCGVVGLLSHNLLSVNMRWPTAAFYFWLFLGLIVGYFPCREILLKSWKQWAAVPVSLVVFGFLFFGVRRYCWDWYRSELLTMAGSLSNSAGKWKEARELLRQATWYNPANVRARYYFAYAYFQQKRFKEAIEAYHALKDYSPNYCQVHYNLAACHLSLGEWEEAAKAYAQQRRLGGMPEGMHFESLLSVLRGKRSHEEKYRKSLEHLVAINPTGIIARNLLGNYHFNKGNFGVAREHYAAILKEDASNIPALNNLAGVYFSEENFAEARNICLRILEITPNEAVPMINLGKAHYMLGDYPEARQVWLKARELAPERNDIDGFLEMLSNSD